MDVVPAPVYPVNDYLISICPSVDISEKILKTRQDFANEFQVHFTNNTVPGVTLARFSQLEMMEERIFRRLATISMGIRPMLIELQNFGSLPSHSIFLNIVTKTAIQGLVKNLKCAQNLLQLNADNKPFFTNDLFLPIAIKLKPWQYEKGWMKYSQLHFSGKFVAEEIQLLRKRSGEKQMKLIKRFCFSANVVKTEQGNLFL